jgi:hypothetical protein
MCTYLYGCTRDMFLIAIKQLQYQRVEVCIGYANSVVQMRAPVTSDGHPGKERLSLKSGIIMISCRQIPQKFVSIPCQRPLYPNPGHILCNHPYHKA